MTGPDRIGKVIDGSQFGQFIGIIFKIGTDHSSGFGTEHDIIQGVRQFTVAVIFFIKGLSWS